MSVQSPVRIFRDLAEASPAADLAESFNKSGLKAALQNKCAGAEVQWGTGNHAGITYLQHYTAGETTTYSAYIGSQYGDRLTITERLGQVSLSFGARSPALGGATDPVAQQNRAFEVLEFALRTPLMPAAVRPSRIEMADFRFES